MTPTEFRAALDRLGLTQMGAGRVLGVDGRTVRRWASGESDVPEPVRRLLLACERHTDLVPLLTA
jgi:DNA-binding transcriptional regulator YiaG